MVRVCDEKKVLFVHIQKTGGSSVHELFRIHGLNLRGLYGKHSRACDAMRELGDERFMLYYRCAFVRNPWDRMVSWHNMFTVGYRGRLGRAAWKAGGHDFAQFVRSSATIYRRWGPMSIGFNQLDYLTDEHGTLLVNDVYRFEDFENECRRLGARIGVKWRTIPHRNFHQHRHYSTYYTDELRDIIHQKYAKDIEAFGYRFDAEPGK